METIGEILMSKVIDAVINSDPIDFKDEIYSQLAGKVAASIEVQKQIIAKDFIRPSASDEPQIEEE